MELRRGKSTLTGEWIIGAAICIGEKAYILGSESIFPERPAYNRLEMGFQIGYSDKVKDRQKAAEYGWEKALEKYEENFPKWIEVVPETVTRCCDKCDVIGNVLFEGDVIQNSQDFLFEICYGRYLMYCPADDEFMENVGFFTVSIGVQNMRDIKEPMPLGPTEDYGHLVGNIFDNPALIQHAAQEAGEDATQPLLKSAT